MTAPASCLKFSYPSIKWLTSKGLPFGGLLQSTGSHLRLLAKIIRIPFVFWFAGHFQLFMRLLSSLSSMGIENFMHISHLQISESFYWNFMVKHEYVSYFLLLLGESPVLKCFKLLLATIQSCGLQLIHRLLFFFFQHSLTLTKASFSLAPKILQKVW
jgi:hypothetical protein